MIVSHTVFPLSLFSQSASELQSSTGGAIKQRHSDAFKNSSMIKLMPQNCILSFDIV